MARELDIAEIQDEVSTAGLKEAATANRTFPTGVYNLQLQKGTPVENDKGEKSLSFNVAFIDQATGERKGTGFFNAAWEEKWREGKNGKYLDKDSRLFGQLLRVFNLPSGTGPLPVLRAFEGQMVGAFVTESLRSPEGVSPTQYLDVVSPDTAPDAKSRDAMLKKVSDGKAIERAKMGELLEMGWRGNNYVQSISKAK